MSPPVQDKVPRKEIAGSLTIRVPSFEGTGSLRWRAPFWAKAKPQYRDEASQKTNVLEPIK
jgi:hypothetical protein